MRRTEVCRWLLWMLTMAAPAQLANIHPQVRSQEAADPKITTIELTAHFVTTIRVPEAVNSVVVGDPALFQAEHSEQEPYLVFIKPLSTEDAESNLLISTAKGHQISLLLLSHRVAARRGKVDFLLRYQASGDFLIEPAALPFALIAQTTSLATPPSSASGPIAGTAPPTGTSVSAAFNPGPTQEASSRPKSGSLDSLLERQQQAPLPMLYGQRIEGGEVRGDLLRAGVSEVIDGGQQVMVLFSVVNRCRHAILLMPPQVQLGGKERSGKLVKREHWSTAEQLAVIDFRMNRRRIGPGERADGVVLFERPPYKRSTETLFLQMAESGAVDRPALAPIGFGVSTLGEAANHVQ